MLLQAVFLPRPSNCEVVSHPVRLLNMGSVNDWDWCTDIGELEYGRPIDWSVTIMLFLYWNPPRSYTVSTWLPTKREQKWSGLALVMETIIVTYMSIPYTPISVHQSLALPPFHSLIGVRHNFTVTWAWQEFRLDSLEPHTGPHWHTSGLYARPWQLQTRLLIYSVDWTLYYMHVQQGRCQRDQVSLPNLHHLKLIAGKHPTYPSCGVQACKASDTTC
jgi:hypothetical protein